MVYLCVNVPILPACNKTSNYNWLKSIKKHQKTAKNAKSSKGVKIEVAFPHDGLAYGCKGSHSLEANACPTKPNINTSNSLKQ